MTSGCRGDAVISGDDWSVTGVALWRGDGGPVGCKRGGEMDASSTAGRDMVKLVDPVMDREGVVDMVVLVVRAEETDHSIALGLRAVEIGSCVSSVGGL